jgi:PPOX class probable F420-dependent enzyme
VVCEGAVEEDRSVEHRHPLPIPPSHKDLLESPLIASLATLLSDGYPQVHPVWFSYEDPYVLVNTMKGFRKERNMRDDPRVSVLIVDATGDRWLETRGQVELVEAGARRHLDLLAARYEGAEHYFGDVVEAELAEHEVPVIGRITPMEWVTNTEADRAVSEAKRAPATPEAPAVDGARVSVPESHVDLLTRPLDAALTTLFADGRPQTQPVWCDFDGRDVLVNTTRERAKGKNMQRDPRASILVVDPQDTGRWIEVRGDVSISERGAEEHIDKLAAAYTDSQRFFGEIVPMERKAAETRIVCRIRPRRVVCDAIHH